jgi:acyl carrier protein
MPSSTLDRVIQIISQTTSPASDEPLDASTVLTGGGVATDSVAVLEMILALEMEFNIELSAEELARTHALESIGQLAACIDAKLNAPA